jgi:hypothetical protein
MQVDTLVIAALFALVMAVGVILFVLFRDRR